MYQVAEQDGEVVLEVRVELLVVVRQRQLPQRAGGVLVAVIFLGCAGYLCVGFGPGWCFGRCEPSIISTPCIYTYNPQQIMCVPAREARLAVLVRGEVRGAAGDRHCYFFNFF